MGKISPALIPQLIQRAPEAYNIFYLETVDMFYRYMASRYTLRGQDIEDVLSNFYIKFWKVVDRYDAAYAFETYMWTVFRNVVKDYFKREHNLSFVDETVVEQEVGEDASIIDVLEQDFQFADIQQAMHRIDEVSYDVIFLKFIEQRTHEEIAVELGLSQEAVRQRISRGLRKLKALLEEDIK